MKGTPLPSASRPVPPDRKSQPRVSQSAHSTVTALSHVGARPPNFSFLFYRFGVHHGPPVTDTVGTWQSAPTRLCLFFEKLRNITR